MAIVTTQAAPDIQRFAFQGLDEIKRPRSEVPRAEVFYNLIEFEVPQPGAGNTQQLQITCVLPQAFTYAISEIHLRVLQGGAQGQEEGLDSVCRGVFQNAILESEASFQLTFGGVSTGISAGVVRLYNFNDDLPKALMLPHVPAQPGAIILIVNSDIDDGDAWTVEFFMRTLQFDIDQLHYWQVNTPTPIR